MKSERKDLGDHDRKRPRYLRARPRVRGPDGTNELLSSQHNAALPTASGFTADRGSQKNITCFSLPQALAGSPFPGHSLIFTACSKPFMIPMMKVRVLHKFKDDSGLALLCTCNLVPLMYFANRALPLSHGRRNAILRCMTKDSQEESLNFEDLPRSLT